ncbi:hybrid sensor histidine kinase/response regulator transcription factor [soil metagenome]
MPNRRIYIIAFLLFFFNNSYSQSYYFRHYQVENGISNNATICSLQDKMGFLWFGTKDGLNRYDGYTFKIFSNSPEDSLSIGNNFIHCLYEDPTGILWVGTENGLYKYDAVTERFALLKFTKNLALRDIRMDSKGNFWMICGFTLIKYNVADQSLSSYETNKFFSATSLCMAADGDLLISTTTGFLERYNTATNSFTSYDLFSHSKLTVSRWVERLYTTSDGTILAGTSNQGVKLFNPKSSTYIDILTYNTNKTEIFVRNFIQVNDAECWIGTETGIFIYNLNNGHVTNLQKKYNDPYSISDNAVYCFTKDREGGIWAGTYFGGINYFPKQYTTFTKYFPMLDENSISGNVVREIHQDHSGNLWIGTEDAGLNKFDTATKLFTHYLPEGNKTSIAGTNIHGLLLTGDEAWIGYFENGLDVLNIKTGKVKKHYSKGAGVHDLKSNFIYCITRSLKGDIMLGTTQGAYVYNNAADNFDVMKGMPETNWYTGILNDGQGSYWASTYGNGVNYYNPATGATGNYRYNINDKNSLASDRVNSIFKDSKNTLWFATEGGLCSLDKTTGKFTRYTTENGFPSSFILSILEDADQNLWISTSRGLVCFNPQTKQVIVYTKINGILSNQFNFSAAYKDQRGKMYFGSVKGMISFNPAQFIKDSFAPPIYLTGFQIFNKELTIADNGSPLTKSIINTDKITLAYDQSTFSIDFASLSYTAPEMTEYAYQMEGLDNNWIYLKTNRKVYFTELSPGSYAFKVKAANSSNMWTKEVTTLTIQILPPWWLNPWAYFMYVLAGLLIIFYLIRNYHARTEEKNKRKIEALETAKEKEIFQAKIDFFTNVAHEIRTPLTLIKGPLEKVIRNTQELPVIKDSLKIMERNTNRLIDLSNQLLDFRQTEIKGFNLNLVKTNISELLEDTFVNFKPLAEQKNLAFNLKMPTAILWAWVDVEAFNKILTNLFSNAVKYADKKVMVELLPFRESDDIFTLEIKNDGYLVPYEMKEKIFEPFYRLKATEKQKGTGIGLALSRSLVQLHKGILDMKEPDNMLNIFYLTMPVNQDK